MVLPQLAGSLPSGHAHLPDSPLLAFTSLLSKSNVRTSCISIASISTSFPNFSSLFLLCDLVRWLYNTSCGNTICYRPNLVSLLPRRNPNFVQGDHVPLLAMDHNHDRDTSKPTTILFPIPPAFLLARGIHGTPFLSMRPKGKLLWDF